MASMVPEITVRVMKTAPENGDPNYPDDPNHQGGPTIFDRRGSGERALTFRL